MMATEEQATTEGGRTCSKNAPGVSMKPSPGFACLRRIGKQDYKGILTLTNEWLIFKEETSTVDSRHHMKDYIAHRQHPKQPMIQIRFNMAGGSVEVLTFVFKDETTRLEVLQEFFSTFTKDVQAHQETKQVAGSKAPAGSPPETEKKQVLSTLHDSDLVQPVKKIKSTEAHQETREVSESSMGSALDVLNIKKERRRILEAVPDLQLTYQCLVGKFITEEQFWKNHQVQFNLYSQHTSDTGFSKAFFQLPPGLNPNKVDVDQLSPSARESLVEEFPCLAKLQSSLVPEKMSQDEFWNRFLQSQLFYDILGMECPSVADKSMFPSLKEMELKPTISEAELETRVPFDLNLCTSQGLVQPGYGTILGSGALVGESSQKPQRHATRFVMERLNRYSRQCLESLLESQSQGAAYLQHELLEKRPEEREGDALRLEDLMVAVTEDIPPEKEVFPLELHWNTKASWYEEGKPSYPQDKAGQTEALLNRLEQWNYSTDTLSTTEAKCLFLLNTKLIQKCLMLDHKKVNETLENVEFNQYLSQVIEHQSHLRELLEAFWTSDLTQYEYQKKLISAIHHCMEEINQVLTQPKSANVGGPSTSTLMNRRILYQPLLEVCRTAIDRFQLLKHTAEQQRLNYRRLQPSQP